MASSMMVSSTAAAATTNMVAAFNGLKSSSAFPVTRKSSSDFASLPSNGGRVQCMKVWPIVGKKKFETLSYLPDLTVDQLVKQIDYLLRSGWVPCLEFSYEGFVYREYGATPGYYDGRYWTMWKLPMFGCTDAAQVVKELEECKKEYPKCFVRIIGFDNNRQVQCVSFIAYKPYKPTPSPSTSPPNPPIPPNPHPQIPIKIQIPKSPKSDMKIFVKTLKNSQFEIEVNPDDTVADVKKAIESSQGKTVYPTEEQMLIYQGKVLTDAATLAESNVTEDKFLVIMLKKPKASSSGASTASAAAPTSQARPAAVSSTPIASSATPVAPSAPSAAPASATTAPPTASPALASAGGEADVYGQAASNLVAGNNLEQTIQQILDMGGGTWDRDTVVRALRAAFNNPERAIDYLYSGIPEQAEAPPPVARVPGSGQAANPTAQAPQAPQPAQPAVPLSGPNANPLDLFPQGLPSVAGAGAGVGGLDFLRNSPQFRALQAMVQANPQILQPMLQELGKQNPQIMRLIQENQADFLRLINEPAEGDSNLLDQLAAGMPQTLAVTPEEREAIGRLEAMGFERALVLEVFFACDKNEEAAANYLLDHMHEFEEQ